MLCGGFSTQRAWTWTRPCLHTTPVQQHVVNTANARANPNRIHEKITNHHHLPCYCVGCAVVAQEFECVCRVVLCFKSSLKIKHPSHQIKLHARRSNARHGKTTIHHHRQHEEPQAWGGCPGQGPAALSTPCWQACRAGRPAARAQRWSVPLPRSSPAAAALQRTARRSRSQTTWLPEQRVQWQGVQRLLRGWRRSSTIHRSRWAPSAPAWPGCRYL